MFSFGDKIIESQKGITTEDTELHGNESRGSKASVCFPCHSVFSVVYSFRLFRQTRCRKPVVLLD